MPACRWCKTEWLIDGARIEHERACRVRRMLELSDVPRLLSGIITGAMNIEDGHGGGISGIYLQLACGHSVKNEGPLVPIGRRVECSACLDAWDRGIVAPREPWADDVAPLERVLTALVTQDDELRRVRLELQRRDARHVCFPGAPDLTKDSL